MHKQNNRLRIALLLSLSSAIAAPAFACEPGSADRYRDLAAQQLGAKNTLIEFSAWQKSKEVELRCLAAERFKAFLGKGRVIEFRSLVQDALDQSLFLQALNEAAVEDTLKFLAESGSGPAARFAGTVRAQASQSGLGFSLVESSAALEGRPAAFVRAQSHVIMNYGAMTRDEWLVIFIHEFAHFVDADLRAAVDRSVVLHREQPRLAQEIAGWVRSGVRWDQLTKTQQDQIDEFLRLGLRRGILAEITAWSTTFAIYADLKAIHQIDPIAWMDAIAGTKHPRQSWGAAMARYLSPRFPLEGAFYLQPLIRSRIAELEKEPLSERR